MKIWYAYNNNANYKEPMKLNLRFFEALPAREKRLTISTLFTILRVFLTPFIVGAMMYRGWGIAFGLFCVAAISDVLDGFLARLRGEQTFLGACLDPVADKILVLSCFFSLAFVQTPLFTLPPWFVWLVLIKEMVLVGGAFVLFFHNGHIEIKPRFLGKATTVVQMIFIAWLFSCYFFQWVPIKTYSAMVGLMIILMITSLVDYLTIGINMLKRG